MANSTQQHHAVIVGAGLTGLMAGYRIACAGIPVTIYEAAKDFSEAEGLVTVGSSPVEVEFDPVLPSDADLLQLLDDLDARSLLEWQPSRFGVFLDGRIIPFDHHRDLRTLRTLGFWARRKLARRFARLLKDGLPGASEEISAERWLEKQCGKEAVSALWSPLLHGFWSKRASRVSAAWMARRLGRITEARSTGDGTSAYLSGSSTLLAQRLVNGIEANGGRVLYGKMVQEVLTSSEGLKGVFIEGQVVQTSSVVLCQRPDHIRALSPGLPESFFERLEIIPFQSLIRLTLQLDRPFGHLHRLIVCDGDLPFSELVEHTSWISPEQYGQQNILHLTAGHTTGDPALEDPEEKILDLFNNGLGRINPDFNRHWVTGHQLRRDLRSCPVPVAGSPLAAPVSTTPVPGIFLAAEAAHGRRYRGPAASAAIGARIASLLVAAATGDLQQPPAH